MLLARRRSAPCLFCAFRTASFSSITSTNLKPDSSYRRPVHSDKKRRPPAQFRLRDKSVYDKEDRKVYGIPGKRRVYGSLKEARNQEDAKEDSTRFLSSAFSNLRRGLPSDNYLAGLNLEPTELNLAFRDFQRRTIREINNPKETESLTVTRLRKASDPQQIRRQGIGLLETELRHAFYGDAVLTRQRDVLKNKPSQFSDLRYPPEWYVAARRMRREIHLHVGPTNSGKTYQALKRLQSAETGVYAGPLRLLAHEVYLRLNSLGKRCRLVTGDERKDDRAVASADAEEFLERAPMISCTVEMCPQSIEFDVAVIDEIQMIGSEDRGWAWTEAFLGLQAREIHLCGEERAVPIIREIAALCGENVQVHRYERLSPLKMMSKSLDGNLRNLRKGDCIVTFSVMMIHGLRQIIEKTLKKKVAIIYGSLPPETRAQQAKLFNDPDNDYDILVASNAVGMGLNLNIKRMIFQSSTKTIGGQIQAVSVAETKQIAGRAGRFSTAQQDIAKASVSSDLTTSPEPPKKQIGLVTALEKFDFGAIEKAMTQTAEPITSAGVLPPFFALNKFAKYFAPETPFSHIMIRLCEFVKLHTRFFICDLKQIISIADAIHPVKGLDLPAKMQFCSAPIEPRKPGEIEVAQACARAVAESKPVNILNLQGVHLELLDEESVPTREYLAGLERLHKALIVFMWLSFRFEDIFIERHLTEHVKTLVEKRIADVLALLSIDYDKMRKNREQAILDMLASEEKVAKVNETPDMDSVESVEPQNTEESWEDGSIRRQREMTARSAESLTPNIDNPLDLEQISDSDQSSNPDSTWRRFSHDNDAGDPSIIGPSTTPSSRLDILEDIPGDDKPHVALQRNVAG